MIKEKLEVEALIRDRADIPREMQGIGCLERDNAFNCDAEGLAMGALGCARMSSAMHGIQTIAGILLQRELGSIVISENVGVGLINALGSCAELAQGLMSGHDAFARMIGTEEPDYPALERLVRGK